MSFAPRDVGLGFISSTKYQCQGIYICENRMVSRFVLPATKPASRGKAISSLIMMVGSLARFSPKDQGLTHVKILQALLPLFLFCLNGV